MRELSFYRQKRYDGGVRTGIELDGETILGIFDEGPPDEQDNPMGSALLWYVDVRCRGEDLPDDAEAARGWLIEHAETILSGLYSLSENLAVGLDDGGPIVWRDFPQSAQGVYLEVVCSSIRRIGGLEISAVLKDIADHFVDIVQQLAPPEPARF
jgi:hypothetical protein